MQGSALTYATANSYSANLALVEVPVQNRVSPVRLAMTFVTPPSLLQFRLQQAAVRNHHPPALHPNQTLPMQPAQIPRHQFPNRAQPRREFFVVLIQVHCDSTRAGNATFVRQPQ